MKSDLKKRHGWLPFALAALTITASLALPGAAAMWEDASLYRTPAARPAVSGAMSSQGRGLPVAYELYRKRLLSGESITAQEEVAEPLQSAKIFGEKTQSLADAGVLPPDAARMILTCLPEAGTAAISSQDGVTKLSCQHWQIEEGTEPSGWRCEAQWLASSGLVTSYSATFSMQETDAGSMLTAYRTYLGLDALTDWKMLDTASLAPGTAAMWSEDGQIYLYCFAGDGNLSFGAVSVTQESLP